MLPKTFIFLLFATFLQLSNSFLSSANGFTKAYMGWSTWSLQATTHPDYGSGWFNETSIVAQANILADKLLEYGFDHISLDSGWSAPESDQFGRFVAHPTLFPQFPEMIFQLKQKGLQVGVYLIPGVYCSDIDQKKPIYNAGDVTMDMIATKQDANVFSGSRCRLNFKHPGAQAWVDSQVKMLADWGVTFIKLDGCLPGSSSSITSWDTKADVVAYHQAISKLPNRNMWLTVSWAVDEQPDSMAVWRGNADGFRVATDIEQYGINMTYYAAVRRNVAAYWRLMSITQSDEVQGWPDMDSLLVGMDESISGLTQPERRTMFTMWVLSQSPLFIGDDLSRIDDFGWSLLTNKNVLGLRGKLPSARYLNADSGDRKEWCARQFWYAPVGGDEYVVGFVNLGGDDADAESDHYLTLKFSWLGMDGNWVITDVWTGNQVVSSQSGSYTVLVKKHDSQLYLFKRISSGEKDGFLIHD